MNENIGTYYQIPSETGWVLMGVGVIGFSIGMALLAYARG